MKRTTMGIAGVLLAGVVASVQLAGCDEGCRVICEADCDVRGFEISCESGASLYEVRCQTSYDYSAGYRRIEQETCNGTRTYENSGKAYKFSSHYDGKACKGTLNVEGFGDVTCAPPAPGSRGEMPGTGPDPGPGSASRPIP